MSDITRTSPSSYWSYNLLIILYFGFLSGLPLALTGATLSAWLAETHIDIKAIGLFAAVATPYTLKFLWAPLMDSLPFPLLSKQLGRRRSWIIATQAGLTGALLFLGIARPDINLFTTAIAALLVSFMSASQDIVIDAYRVEILTLEDQGRGAAMAQLGYRLGMIASSAGALKLASHIGWQETYFLMAAIIAAGTLITLIAKRPHITTDAWAHGGVLDNDSAGETSQSEVGGSVPPISNNNALQSPQALGSEQRPGNRSRSDLIKDAVINPFLDFMKHESWLLILTFIVVYKLADAFIGFLTNPFLISIGFNIDQIANIVKIYGTIATLLGTFIGGSLVSRYGTIRIMFVAGFLHAITNLMYVVQAHVGADPYMLAAGTAMENITGGISAAAFIAFLSSLCNVHYTATQYALLSSLAALGRTWLSTPAGYVVKAIGWEWFFGLATLLALPGLAMLWYLQKRLTISSNKEVRPAGRTL